MLLSYVFIRCNVDCPELLSILGLHTSLINFRVKKLFCVQFFTTNYSSASYLPRVLRLTNKIENFIDFFFISYEVFKSNVYNALTNCIS